MCLYVWDDESKFLGWIMFSGFELGYKFVMLYDVSGVYDGDSELGFWIK